MGGTGNVGSYPGVDAPIGTGWNYKALSSSNLKKLELATAAKDAKVKDINKEIDQINKRLKELEAKDPLSKEEKEEKQNLESRKVTLTDLKSAVESDYQKQIPILTAAVEYDLLFDRLSASERNAAEDLIRKAYELQSYESLQELVLTTYRQEIIKDSTDAIENNPNNLLVVSDSKTELDSPQPKVDSISLDNPANNLTNTNVINQASPLKDESEDTVDELKTDQKVTPANNQPVSNQLGTQVVDLRIDQKITPINNQLDNPVVNLRDNQEIKPKDTLIINPSEVIATKDSSVIEVGDQRKVANPSTVATVVNDKRRNNLTYNQRIDSRQITPEDLVLEKTPSLGDNRRSVVASDLRDIEGNRSALISDLTQEKISGNDSINLNNQRNSVQVDNIQEANLLAREDDLTTRNKKENDLENNQKDSEIRTVTLENNAPTRNDLRVNPARTPNDQRIKIESNKESVTI